MAGQGRMPSKEEIRSAAPRTCRATMTAADLASRRRRHRPPRAALGRTAVAAGSAGTFAAYLGVGLRTADPPAARAPCTRPATGSCCRSASPTAQLSWVFWTPATEFVRSRYAPIQEPVGERHGIDGHADAAGIFLPATAVDLSGNRIGQGGGYYDKFLAAAWTAGRRCALPTAAVVYDTEVLPAGTIPPSLRPPGPVAVLTPVGRSLPSL